jgi:vacuolar-type H+-ATPase subunit I/STV1
VEPAQVDEKVAPVEKEASPPPLRDRQPASLAGVQKAIEEVNQIIETLRGTLNDMEEVLETLELAERQKIADEQEIETLRRGLRQLHQPRDRGPHPQRH